MANVLNSHTGRAGAALRTYQIADVDAGKAAGVTVGDVCYCIDTKLAYIWDGAAWNGLYAPRGGASIYGTGEDGDVQITSFTTLYRDMYYRNLLIDYGYGINIDTNGYRLFVQNMLTFGGANQIKVVGGIGFSDGTPGVGGGDINGWYAIGKAGGAGDVTNGHAGVSSTCALGGYGGAGGSAVGAGGPAGSVTNPGASMGDAFAMSNIIGLLLGYVKDQQIGPAAGGGGGGGDGVANKGAGGGGGSPHMLVAARRMEVLSGSAAIHNEGGPGGDAPMNAYPGGGGGGGGSGVLGIITDEPVTLLTSSTAQITTPGGVINLYTHGGDFGNGNLSGNNGLNGSPGPLIIIPNL